MRKLALAAASGAAMLMAAVGLAVAAGAAIPAYVDSAVADSARPDADRQRDPERKPAEVLTFAGVRPGEKVGELIPGGLGPSGPKVRLLTLGAILVRASSICGAPFAMPSGHSP